MPRMLQLHNSAKKMPWAKSFKDMRDPCQPAFQICIGGGGGGTWTVKGFWWEMREDDSPGSNRTRINPKSSKKESASLFWCWLTVGPWLSLLVALKLKICETENRSVAAERVKTASTFTFVYSQLLPATNPYPLCPRVWISSCQPHLWWNWSLQTDGAHRQILQIHFQSTSKTTLL